MGLGLGFDMSPGFLTRVFGVFLACMATSCLQPPSKTDDNGPAVSAEAVQDAIINAWGDVDFSEVRLNEYLYIEQDQKISTLDPRVVYKESTQVTDRTENGEDVTFKMYVRSTALDNGVFKPITALEDEITVRKGATSTKPTSATASAKGEFASSLEQLQKSMQDGTVGLRSGDSRNHFIGYLAFANLLGNCVAKEGWDVSCHNLQVTEGVRSAPIGVSGQPDCGGIPNCQVHYKKVSFEMVVNVTDENGATHPEKIVYEIVLSPDVPYMSHLLDFCFQGMVPAGAQKVVVKICNRVQNFEVGTPNP
jgi:hypothetical protein